MREIAAFGFALLLSGCMHVGGGQDSPSKSICPVSGATVKVKDGTPTMTWKGKQLYFAGEEHLRRFAEAPDAFEGRR